MHSIAIGGNMFTKRILSTAISVLILAGLQISADAIASKQDLQKEIAALLASVDKETAQDVEVVNAVTVAIAPALSLTVGTVAGAKNQTIDLPIYFKAGVNSVSGVQFDLALSTGLSVVGSDIGIAAKVAEKSIQVAPIPGGVRVLIFGLNNNQINSGSVAILKIAVSQNAQAGKRAIPIGSIAASSPIGTGVTMTGRNGSLQIK